jgi:hypothetical protein
MLLRRGWTKTYAGAQYVGSGPLVGALLGAGAERTAEANSAESDAPWQ